MVELLRFHPAEGGRRTGNSIVAVSRIVRNNAFFLHKAHGRIAPEHRGRVLARNGDGHFLDVVRALVVPHHHVEGERLLLILAQRSQLRIFLIQVKRVGAVRRHGYRTPAVQRDAGCHLHRRRRAVRSGKVFVAVIGKQAVGERIGMGSACGGGIGVGGRHLAGNAGPAFGYVQVKTGGAVFVRDDLNDRRIVGGNNGDGDGSIRRTCRAVGIHGAEVDGKGEAAPFRIFRQGVAVRFVQLKGVFTRSAVQHKRAHDLAVQLDGKGVLLSIHGTGELARICLLPGGSNEERSAVPGVGIVAGYRAGKGTVGPVGLVLSGIENVLTVRGHRIVTLLTAHAGAVDDRCVMLDGDRGPVVGASNGEGKVAFGLVGCSAGAGSRERQLNVDLFALRQLVEEGVIVVMVCGILRLVGRVEGEGVGDVAVLPSGERQLAHNVDTGIVLRLCPRKAPCSVAVLRGHKVECGGGRGVSKGSDGNGFHAGYVQGRFTGQGYGGF